MVREDSVSTAPGAAGAAGAEGAATGAGRLGAGDAAASGGGTGTAAATVVEASPLSAAGAGVCGMTLAGRLAAPDPLVVAMFTPDLESVATAEVEFVSPRGTAAACSLGRTRWASTDPCGGAISSNTTAAPPMADTAAIAVTAAMFVNAERQPDRGAGESG